MTEYTSPGTGTNGAAVTTTNHGGQTFFSASNLVFSNTRAHSGSTSMTSTGAAGAAQWSTAASKVFVRQFVWFDTLPTGADFFLLGSFYSGSTYAARLILNANGMARLTTQGSGSATIRATHTATFPLGQWVRCELFIDAGTTTTNGSVRAAYYLDESTTPVWDSGLITGINTAGATGTLATMRYLSVLTPQSWIDDLGGRDGEDAVWAPWPTAASGVEHTSDEADTVGLVDTVTVQLADDESATDVVGITDALTATRGATASRADTVGLTDTTTREVGATRTPADTAGILDAVTTTSSTDRARADTVGLVDAAVRELASVRTVADLLGLTDAAAVTTVITRAPADMVGLVDGLAVQLIQAGDAVVADTATLSDTASPALGAVRAAGDTIGLMDAVTVVAARSVAVQDNVGVLDGYAALAVLERTHADTVGVGDAIMAVILDEVGSLPPDPGDFALGAGGPTRNRFTIGTPRRM